MIHRFIKQGKCFLLDFHGNFSTFPRKNCRITCIISCMFRESLFPERFLRKSSTKRLPCLINRCIIYLVKIARDAHFMHIIRMFRVHIAKDSVHAARTSAAKSAVFPLCFTRFLQFFASNPSIMHSCGSAPRRLVFFYARFCSPERGALRMKASINRRMQTHSFTIKPY